MPIAQFQINLNFTLSARCACSSAEIGNHSIRRRVCQLTGRHPMHGSKDDEKEQLRSGIRRLIGSEDSARYLRSLPDFQVEGELPAGLQSLLESLDQTENKRATRRT